MVYLVNVLVQEAVVEKAVSVVEPDVVADDADKGIMERGDKEGRTQMSVSFLEL